MKENQISNKRKCAFYASQYHCNLIISNYIKQEELKEFIIFTETNQKANIMRLTTVLNFDIKDKENLLNCNWDNDKYKNIKKINESIINNKDLSIFIQGSKEYIEKTNESITNMLNNYQKYEVIDCYEFGEVFLDINNLKKRYSTALNINSF